MSPEVYLTKLSDGGLGGWGIIDETHGGHNVDYNDLQETSVIWAVTIPGESSHVLTGMTYPFSSSLRVLIFCRRAHTCPQVSHSWRQARRY